MRRPVNWSRVRTARLVIVLLAIVVYFLLLSVDALRFFPRDVTDFSSLLLPWARFGFSALVALLFLAVGALVCLYARNRRVALILFSFSFTMMVTFAVQTGAASNDPVLSAIGDSSVALALPLFSVLLLLFPRDYLSSGLPSGRESEDNHQPGRHHYSILLLRCYLVASAFLSIGVVLYITILYLLPWWRLPGWANTIELSYYAIVLTGILVTIIVSYRQASSLRERQQQRIFLTGVILAFAPVLLLTILPSLLSLPPVDGQLSAVTIILLPLALGYSILRYQILVFDRYIRRAVAWMFGSVGLALTSYLVIVLSSLIFSGAVSVSLIVAALVMAMFAPTVWGLAHRLTERLFFNETLHYRRLIESPGLLSSETLDLDESSQLLVQAAVMAFETQEVCLLVLDDDTGYYRPYPELKADDPKAAPQRQLVQRLLRIAQPSASVGSDWLDADEPMLERLASARRPLLLSEASRSGEDGSSAIARYIAITSSLEGPDPLLAPVRTQGKMIGVLVLGERGDRQQYAGPDFEAIYLLLTRFSPVLETSRLYAQKNRHAAILNSLYSANTLPVKTFQTIEEVAVAYAKIAADAVMAGASIWLYNQKDQLLHRVMFTGSGSQLTSLEILKPSQESDWTSCFYEGDSAAHAVMHPSPHVPPCLPQIPRFPFAWIPLKRDQQFLGMLVLTYPRPHVFSQEEKRVLEMFANQCATALENTQFTIALRIANERQKELDRLKDQFIVTASHELRTPLTAVQGYIELLSEHGQELPPEVSTAFVSKARRGCNELVLMVENIMDASRVEIDAEKVQVSPVALAEAVEHVVEILEVVVERENRSIHVDVPTDLLVIANDLRLRQVLLNLVSNAIKYSPAGAGVDITCHQEDQKVTVSVRDQGLGVPLEYQSYLFERFVRLERDMNSPVRGAGLGLYISRQLIEAMGGRIWVESTGVPGEGSVFAFTLNLPKVEVSRKVDQAMPEHQAIS